MSYCIVIVINCYISLSYHINDIYCHTIIMFFKGKKKTIVFFLPPTIGKTGCPASIFPLIEEAYLTDVSCTDIFGNDVFSVLLPRLSFTKNSPSSVTLLQEFRLTCKKLKGNRSCVTSTNRALSNQPLPFPS